MLRALAWFVGNTERREEALSRMKVHMIVALLLAGAAAEVIIGKYCRKIPPVFPHAVAKSICGKK